MKLFTVGPVEMEREIITANDGGIPYFRNQEFSEKMLKIQERLLELLNAPKGYRSVILTCSGTGGMESAICSIPKDKRVLIINGGTFGNRFKEIAEVHKISYDEIKVDVDKDLTRADLEKYLNNNIQYFALICNVDETSVGKLYDTKLLREFADKKKCYLILDAISSAFADEYDLSEIKADVTILSSQKALSLAPGISILILSQRYIDEVITKSEERVSYYLDLKDHLKNMERGQTPFTPALAEIEQLRVRLTRIKSYADEVRAVGEKARYFREQIKLKTKSFKLPNYHLSNCVTPLICLNNNASEVIEKLKGKGFVVNPCGGENKDRMLRVGHIGNITIEDIDNLVNAMKEIETPVKAILMVAGKGTRISNYINGIPKSLVDIGGTKLLLHTIHMLKANGISDITLVVGYRHKSIEDAVKDEHISMVYNPFYSVTNSIASLYLAKSKLDGDVILANGDVFWEDETLKRLLDCKDDVTMLVDKTKVDTGDYFFNVDDDGKILAYGKELKREERNCEYVGICKIRKEFVNNFKEKLENMIENEEYNKWWENVCYDMSENVPIYTLDVDGAFWAEVDRIEDYKKIKAYYTNKHLNEKHSSIEEKLEEMFNKLTKLLETAKTNQSLPADSKN